MVGNQFQPHHTALTQARLQALHDCRFAKLASEREPTANTHLPVIPGVGEDEAHTLDIEA